MFNTKRSEGLRSVFEPNLALISYTTMIILYPSIGIHPGDDKGTGPGNECNV